MVIFEKFRWIKNCLVYLNVKWHHFIEINIPISTCFSKHCPARLLDNQCHCHTVLDV